MNKVKVDSLLPMAYESLANNKVAINGKIIKTYRGQISTFGAAVMNGSILSAIAFFSKDADGTNVHRSYLLTCIAGLIDAKNGLFQYAQKMVASGKEAECKEEIINAALALKLAMNLYDLVE